jgi:sensor c-di-GMP phosphodiesterase-like protein
MGKSLRQVVVAEGVETDVQLNFLKIKGCTQGQGYLFSVPLSPEDFVAFVRSQPE